MLYECSFAAASHRPEERNSKKPTIGSTFQVLPLILRRGGGGGGESLSLDMFCGL